MSEFQKDVYKNMSSPERVGMYMAKALELLELVDIMTDEDYEGLKLVAKYMKENGGSKKCNKYKSKKKT